MTLSNNKEKNKRYYLLRVNKKLKKCLKIKRCKCLNIYIINMYNNFASILISVEYASKKNFVR